MCRHCRSAITTPATVSVARRGSTSAGPAADAQPQDRRCRICAECRSERPARSVCRLSESSLRQLDRAPRPPLPPPIKFDRRRMLAHQCPTESATTVASAPVNFSASSAMSRNDSCRVGAGQHLGGDIPGCLDPRLSCPGLLVEPRVVDRDTGCRGEGFDQYLVVFAERSAVGFLSQVEIAEHFVADRALVRRGRYAWVGDSAEIRLRLGGAGCRPAEWVWARRSAAPSTPRPSGR